MPLFELMKPMKEEHLIYFFGGEDEDDQTDTVYDSDG